MAIKTVDKDYYSLLVRGKGPMRLRLGGGIVQFYRTREIMMLINQSRAPCTQSRLCRACVSPIEKSGQVTPLIKWCQSRGKRGDRFLSRRGRPTISADCRIHRQESQVRCCPFKRVSFVYVFRLLPSTIFRYNHFAAPRELPEVKWFWYLYGGVVCL